jgi:hypothetical protein
MLAATKIVIATEIMMMIIWIEKDVIIPTGIPSGMTVLKTERAPLEARSQIKGEIIL